MGINVHFVRSIYRASATNNHNSCAIVLATRILT